MATMDPLNINYLKQSRELLRSIRSIPVDIPARCTSVLITIEQVIRASPVDPKRLLRCLSDALAIPELTWLVATAFRPILIDLAARWLDDSPAFTFERLHCLAYLLEVHEELYPILLRLLKDMPSAEALLPSAVGTPLSVEHYHHVLVTFYRLLAMNPDLSRLLKISHERMKDIMDNHCDRGIRILAVHFLAMQGRLTDGERDELLTASLGIFAADDAHVEAGCVFGTGRDGLGASLQDGWIIPLSERKRIADLRAVLKSVPSFFDWTPTDHSNARPLVATDLSRPIVSVCGVLVIRVTLPSHVPLPFSRPFVVTKSAHDALRNLALHYSQQLPCLLSSSPSAGKTTLLQHFATLIRGDVSDIVSIHLADSSIDAKSLLGTYVSSPATPGTFDWIDGPLVRAMKLGKWIVLEDIDRAGQDVLSTLVPLLESMGPRRRIGAHASVDVPGRGRVYARDGFMIFATRSVTLLRQTLTVPSNSRPFPVPTFFGHQHLSEISLPVPTMDELPVILQESFPSLHESVLALLITVWKAARDSVASLRGDAKEVELLALFKLCHRVSSMRGLSAALRQGLGTNSAGQPNRSVQEEIFLEALDVFVAHISQSMQEGRPRAVVDQIAAALDISEDRISWILAQRTPELRVSGIGAATTTTIGRASFQQDSRRPVRHRHERPFALHRPSLRLLEQLAIAALVNEPVLLVGETGTGKTSAVQHLATMIGPPLTALNLSTQTEAMDIVGGLKPVDPRLPATELQEQYLALFANTFSRKKNSAFVDSVRRAFVQGRWLRLCGLWRESSKLALERLSKRTVDEQDEEGLHHEHESLKPKKRRKVDAASSFPELPSTIASWTNFLAEVTAFEVQHLDPNARFVFSFVEGPLVTALKRGEWILLDEINLASPDVLESILSILEGPGGSITLTERGDLQAIPRHASFRLFACMNPATDIGKRDLPPRIRRHFTEIFVSPPEADKHALLAVVEQYLGGHALGDRSCLLDVVELYLTVKDLASSGRLADGANQAPHYNMRTLTRTMTYAAEQSSTFGLRRALWEGFLMCFAMTLDQASSALVRQAGETHILGRVRNAKSLLRQIPPIPSQSCTDQFAPFYLEKGPLPIPSNAGDYILTPSVRIKLLDLARIIGAKDLPVLIQGPTSSGKTSSIEYLARRTGHRFIRINNHEHTDIQEYLGSYVSDPTTGKLVYKDGLLVRALRNGDWLVLDELNLAPSDVLEALNRLLDDNRELVIPETGEVIRPHVNFALFATQNPPGLYGGRKPLSRAFRNRFVEVHFDDVPESELEVILCQRCKIAPSYATRIVSVFKELQRRRQATRIFETKHSFATLRDLFRWANRGAESVQSLAENGYMLLAERARRTDDKEIVRDVLEEILRVRIDPPSLYERHASAISIPRQLVLTSAMKRLWILVSEAIRHDEPVLLVGETGTGKTTVCDLMAAAHGRPIYTVNCHLNTETGDLIGGLRPVRDKATRRNRLAAVLRSEMEQAGFPFSECRAVSPSNLRQALDDIRQRTDLPSPLVTILRELHEELVLSESFVEWKDGPLVEAMRCGAYFMLDEISLADDSVLERLNSVLEPSRSLVLAEMGGRDIAQLSITAQVGFQFLATMNPGGDYGKKELSPALRNRFTEIYVPSIDEASDRFLIISGSWSSSRLSMYTEPLLKFWEWIEHSFDGKVAFGLRDILAWIGFMNKLSSERHSPLTLQALFHHAARMTFVDALGFFELSGDGGVGLSASVARANSKLMELVPLRPDELASFIPTLSSTPSELKIGPFSLAKGPILLASTGFTFVAPTTHENALRLLRAAQLPKAILLEGSPGVGKTSIVVALANATGQNLCRINLSDQTELTDLFGSDLPVEGGQPGEFGWKSAAFLRSMESGGWVLLDEMNLAPQPVLEGLNAVLDHRGQVYIPELGRAFRCHPDFRVFAAQNPLQQGGDRKGLPKSFLNRFTRVYMSDLTDEDYLAICRNLHPKVPEDHLRQLVYFNRLVARDTRDSRYFSNEGSPWDFNLRDLLRWLTLYDDNDQPLSEACQRSFRTIYLARLRSVHDRNHVQHLFQMVFGNDTGEAIPPRPWFELADHQVQFGQVLSPRLAHNQSDDLFAALHSQLDVLEYLAASMKEAWMVILTGYKRSGKTSIARLMARACGAQLTEFSMNSASDANDLLGGFEQWNEQEDCLEISSKVRALLFEHVASQPAHRLLVQDMCDKLNLIERSDEFATPAEQLAAVVAYCSQVVVWLSIHETSSTAQLQSLKAALQSHSHLQSYKGRFRWVDGPFVRAMREGHWLLLDNANLCNSAVLDRLNSVLEDNGRLLLNERGLIDDEIQEIRPHPSFRIIMTVDPQYGELSRAMRNRGVEIFVRSPFSLEADRSRLLQMIRCPSTSFTADDLFMPALEAKQLRLGLISSAIEATTETISALSLYDALFLTNSRLARHVMTMAALETVKEANPRSIYLTRATRSSESLSLRRVQALLDKAGEGQQMIRLPLFMQEFLYRDRLAFAQQRVLPSTYVSNLPFDHALNPVFDPLIPTGRLQKETFCADVVPVLDLATSRVLNDVSIRRVLDVQTKSPGSTALSHCARLVSIVVDDIEAFLENVLTEPQLLSDPKATASLLLDLADCTRALQTILLEVVPNYSAITAISKWFIQNRILSHRSFTNTLALVGDLQSSVRPQTGLEMFAIWWNTWNGSSQAGFNVNSASIVHSSQLSPVSSSAGVLQRPDKGDAFGPHSPSKKVAILMAGSTCLVELCDAWTIALTGLQFVGTFPQNQVLLDSLSHMVSGHGAYSSLRLASWKYAGMHASQGSMDASFYSPHLIFEWLHSLKLSWNAGEYQVDLDPGLIFSPVELHNTTQSLAQAQTVASLIPFKSALEKRAMHYTILATAHPLTRYTQMRQLLIKSVQNLCAGFGSTYPPDVLHRILRFSPLRQIDQDDHQAWLVALQETSNVNLAQVCMARLVPAMEPLFRATIPYRESVRLLAMAWVALSRTMLALYLPDIPTDPLVNITARLHLLEQRSNSLASQLELHKRGEWLLNGHQANPRITSLSDSLAATAKDIASIQPPPISRPSDPSTLNAFYEEIAQFLDQVLDAGRIDSLIHDLSSLTEPHGLRVADTVHRSIDAFVQRLGQAYPGLDDIAFTAVLCIRAFQLGIKLATRAGSIDEDALLLNNSTLSVSLTQFPATAAASYVIRNKALLYQSASEALTTPNIILSLCLIAQQACRDRFLDVDMDVIQAFYRLLYSRWSMQQEKTEAIRLAQESLYRSKNEDHQDESEEDRIERELHVLFPDFEEESDHKARTTDPKKAEPHTIDMGGVTQSQMLTIHATLFNSSESRQPMSGVKIDHLIRALQLDQLASLDYTQLSDQVDQGSQIYRLTLLQDALSVFMDRPSIASEHGDFYWGKNLAELHKVFLALSSLESRLATLIPLWPEQVQLQDILDRCQSVLGLSSDSSLAQVMPGLEGLVTHIAAWEEFSSRDNSLGSYQAQLIALIVEWRRKELSCWAQLLDTESLSFATRVAEWWFILYGAVIASPASTDQGDLKEIASLLDDFVTSSPLGQFQARLELIGSFGVFLKLVARTQAEFASRADLVMSITIYYGQFSTSVRDCLLSQRKPLEDDIRSFVQLASWKDVNVDALKQSAKKTHRRLYQAIRKFRSILRQPAKPLLSIFDHDHKISDTTDSHIAVSAGADIILLPYNPTGVLLMKGNSQLHLSTALARLRQLGSSTLHNFVGQGPSEDIDLLGTSLIDRMEEFSSETLKTTDIKSVKALVARKRKAWYDALKELRSIGLSTRLPSRVLQCLTSRHNLLGYVNLVEIVGQESPLVGIIQKADAYFNKLCGMIPVLRTVLVGHQPDLPTRDLERAVGFVECAFSVSLRGRRLLAQLCHAHVAIQGILHRLAPVVSSGSALSLVGFGSVAVHFVRSIYSAAVNFRSVLREIQNGVRLLESHAPSDTLDTSVPTEIARIVATQECLIATITPIMEAVRCTEPAVLLNDELSTLKTAVAAMQQALVTLTTMNSEQQQYSCMLEPTARWLNEALQGLADHVYDPSTMPSQQSAQDLSSKLIASVLFTAQQLYQLTENQQGEGGAQTGVQAVATHFERVVRLLQLDSVQQQLSIVVCATAQEGMQPQPLHNMIPFMQEYSQLLALTMHNLAIHNKSTMKLTYILHNALKSIALRGFCKPQEQDSSQKKADSTTATEGVGIGEGTGAEDASAEVQDESQVEGIKDESMDQTTDETNDNDSGEDGAFEMDQDFDGALEDVRSSDGEESSSDNETEQPDLDETTGNLDLSDPGALDEKLWGDKGADTKAQSEETSTKPPQEPALSNDIGAQTEDKGQRRDLQPEITPPPDESLGAQDMDDLTGDTPREEDSSGGLDTDNDIPLGEALDLPEDLNLDQSQASASSEISEDDDDTRETQPEQDREHELEEGEEVPMDSNVDEGTDLPGEVEATSEERPTVPDDKPEGDAGGEPQSANSNGMDDGVDGGNIGDGEWPPVPGEEQRLSEEAKEERGANMERSPSASLFDNDRQPGVSSRANGQPQSGEGEESDALKSEDAASHPKQPGDLGQKTIRSTEQISTSHAPVESKAPLSGGLEWAHEKDETVADQQALGPQQADETISLNQLNLDDGMEGNDVPATNEAAPESYAAVEEDEMMVDQGLSGLGPDELLGAIVQWSANEHSRMDETVPIGQSNTGISLLKPELASEHGMESFDTRWQAYVSSTQDLAYSLCEQLRLILEPTRATRLQGDYKTGKRLNMKKVIPYIASDFTKDKIWLRRTKPSRREYQVLLALDDSRSMAESQSTSLAFQTLSLVTSALGKLEVGDVGIIRFGEGTEILHDFDQGPVTSEVGERLLSHFQFAQTGTNMEQLLESSIAMLSEARARSKQSSVNTSELWQLEIIISDGVCQGHERLRSLVRKAEEEKIVVVFIVLDSLHLQRGVSAQDQMHGSIMSMMQGSYTEVEGRMEIKMNRYMDTFPFSYYIVLRNIESLPNVLASTLRQFFEIK
ncbi:P-loop containing nucleoside triphosphate hydrolase protein [Calocera cornea HHB12733]|uniref:Midasin n=1 Tax=Calocera cornea HHB12733 TaxID=1353952 RepID=A0A165I3T9_9BASI|nr:P-loop containing nucleoside triphosphate hydrolase protein [Calocera cornea HHB12733]